MRPVTATRWLEDGRKHAKTRGLTHELAFYDEAIRACKDYEALLTQRDALEAEVKRLDPDPVVCGCREAMCPHTPIAQLPRQMLVDHFRERIKTEKTERDALEAREKVLREALETLLDEVQRGVYDTLSVDHPFAIGAQMARAALATGAPKP